VKPNLQNKSEAVAASLQPAQNPRSRLPAPQRGRQAGLQPAPMFGISKMRNPLLRSGHRLTKSCGYLRVTIFPQPKELRLPKLPAFLKINVGFWV